MVPALDQMALETAAEPWWRRGVIYQIYPRSFRDSDGDGTGDLAGVIENIDYLGWLGVDAIWLTPFYPSPMKDVGYDITDHTGVDSLFGDLATFDRLLDEAHAHGIAVVVDFVPNHTSDQHPWFRASRSSREDPKRDWYIWRDPKHDGTSPSPPNNWLSLFGGSAWTMDDATGQAYLHSFLPEQPDLNWRNPAVKEAMFDVARFWLERGVDGFRIDVAHYIMKDPEFRDNPIDPDPDPALIRVLGDWIRQRHLHDIAHPDLHAVYRDFRRLLDSYGAERPRVGIGELYDPDLTVWAGYYGTALDEMHLPFNFHLLEVAWNAAAVRAVVDAIEAAVPAGAWPNWVLGNHDRGRIASRVGPDQARLAMMLLLTLRGTPTLYYGDELGMTNVPIPPDRVRDPWGRAVPGLGRDPQRTPLPWNGSPNAGFTAAGVEPWLPLGEDAARHSVDAQGNESGSMLTFTRCLLALRRAMPALSVGDYRPVDSALPEVFAFLREAQGKRLLVLLNFTPDARRIEGLDLGQGVVAHLVLSTYPDRAGIEPNLSTIDLAPNEGMVVSVDRIGTETSS